MDSIPDTKILIFAHVPPPHHGQSYMVQLMLEGFGGDRRKAGTRGQSASFGIECYHVNACVSKKLEDIGDFRFGKFLLLLGYCLQAIWCHFRYGIDTFYYVPAPGKKSALYRDWLVMFLCRPFFKQVVLHWHAAGLARWLETAVHMHTRSFTFRLLKAVDLSIVLSNYNRADAEKLLPQQTCIVSNGIPDPFPRFEQEVLPRRQARAGARNRLLAGEKLPAELLQNTGGDPQICKVLYLAHCMREKGLFDAIAGVRLANRVLREQGSSLLLHLTIAGNFVTAGERAEFDSILATPDAAGLIHYAGFVSGKEKERLLRESDLLCFPTFYPNENQPVNLIEAMAYGLPVITTRWRSLAEMFPENYPGLVDIQSPEQVSEALQRLLRLETGQTLRGLFVQNFTLQSYLSGLAKAFQSIQSRNSSPRVEPRPLRS